ncbi:hypothetical protein BHM03_00037579 [Ensete ventricosum]|nr:hypothetical protein BHM03_00037579 [Ensete ventricosum]
MVLTVSGVLVKGSDRARWGGLLNDRKSCAKLTKTYPVLCRRRRELRGTCTLSRRSDEGTKATQLAEEKLGSECFDMGTWRWVLLKNIGWTKIDCQRSEHNRRWQRPCDVLAEATYRAICLVVIEAEELENAEANSKYRDKAEERGQGTL